MLSKYVARQFIREVLSGEEWFQTLKRQRALDLLVIAGSANHESFDQFSDVDIFLVCPRKAQLRLRLNPVSTYQYGNRIWEISLVSREKLAADQTQKENLFWWHKSRILECHNSYARIMHARASKISAKQLGSLLWTLYARYELNTDDIEKLKSRDDLVGMRLLANENIKLLLRVVAIASGCFCQEKWLSSTLLEYQPELYEALRNLTNSNPDDTIEFNRGLKSHFRSLLRKHGFKDYELSNPFRFSSRLLTFI